MKKWNVLNKLKVQSENLKIEDLINLLLDNRGIKTAKESEAFLHPKLEDFTPKAVGIDLKQLKKALARIQKAIAEKEQIVVFGDYDVDGITGSAILWETIHKLGGVVLPYIPHRVEEGYGLSVKGISNVMEKILRLLSVAQDDKGGLIITTDNGIVANEAVDFANKNNIDVIITDHHTPPDGEGVKLPAAYAIVHTTKLCGAGVAYLLSKEIKNVITSKAKQSQEKEIATSPLAPRYDAEDDIHLELATLGTVADLVPLTGANRAIVKEGLKILPKTKRLGLQALYKQAGIQKEIFDPYEIGFIIGPRLNASGRIESAMDSLRLLCTTNRARAEELAAKLELVNKERQQLLKEAKEDAILRIKNQELRIKNLLIISSEDYAEGIIGLVAGKLVEEFYRPAIVISKREKHSKASVRSVSGFNIIEFLRLHTEHFVNVGGHPMAAGFTVETEKLELLKDILETKAEEILTEEILTRSLRIDCEIPLSAITSDVYKSLQQLSPFGMGNPEPVFATKNVTIDDFRIMGKDGSHLRLNLSQGQYKLEAVGFGMGEFAAELKFGDEIDVAYTIDENVWRGNTKLQLKVKDIKLSN
ncbi:MAG TPA: single-stranded-DNA-specific exonuclease RecJ [Patescibacteria group bacterium]